MKYADRIRQAKTSQEAILVLAEGIDAVLAAVQAAGPPTGFDSSWGEWPSDTNRAAPSPQPFEVIDVKVDPRELAEAQDAAHQAEIDFEQIHARGPLAGQNTEQWTQELADARDFMWQCQGRVRLLEDPGSIINHGGEIAGEKEITSTTEENGQTMVDIPRVDEARQEARRKLAEAIDLPGFFPNIYRDEPQRSDLIKAYMLGGPLWLNAVGQFDGHLPVIMQMPVNVRQAMVADVRLDSERIAYDLARDIFKDADTDNILDITGQNVDSMITRGGATYQGKGDA
jgi:hypothetical protein